MFRLTRLGARESIHFFALPTSAAQIGAARKAFDRSTPFN
jgi:hypothetical protein